MAGVRTSLLDSLDVSLRMTRQAQELLEQSLFPGIVPLFKERLWVFRIFMPTARRDVRHPMTGAILSSGRSWLR